VEAGKPSIFIAIPANMPARPVDSPPWRRHKREPCECRLNHSCGAGARKPLGSASKRSRRP